MVNEKKQKRYYKVEEKVFIKSLKKQGKIVELVILPDLQIYNAEIQYKNGNNTVTQTFPLWDIDKLKNKKKKYQDIRNKNVVANAESKPTIYFAKVRPTATIPSKNEEDAGYDIYADFPDEAITILPHTVKLIPTGVAVSVTSDWFIEVKERGSTGSRNMARRAGVVDSGYRDEIFVALANDNDIPLIIAKNPSDYERHFEAVVYPYSKAIGQLVMLPVPKANVVVLPYEELKAIPSIRGVGKLGSSNK